MRFLGNVAVFYVRTWTWIACVAVLFFVDARTIVVTQNGVAGATLSQALALARPDDILRLETSELPYDCSQPAGFNVDVQNLTIQAERWKRTDALPDGDWFGVTFDCKGTSRALSIQSSAVVFSLVGIRIVNGYSDGYHGGGALAMENGLKLCVQSCSFLSNKAPSGIGGAVFVSLSPISAAIRISSSHFISNSADLVAGAIALVGGLTSNSASDDYGSCYDPSIIISDCVFTSNTLTASTGFADADPLCGGGGGVGTCFLGPSQNVNMTVTRGTFVDNNNRGKSVGGGGGAIGVSFALTSQNASVAVMSGGKFTNNHNTGLGGGAVGALFSTASAISLVIADGCIFDSNINHGGYGGGGVGVVFAGVGAYYSSVEVKDSCVFADNVNGPPGFGGGGVGVFYEFPPDFSALSVTGDCTFHGNTLVGSFGGGGVGVFVFARITAAKLMISGAAFTNNSCIQSTEADAVRFDGGGCGSAASVSLSNFEDTEAHSNISMVISDTKFIGNRNEFGGAFAVLSSSQIVASQIQIIDCLFRDNTVDVASSGASALVGGGAITIVLSEGNTTAVQIKNSTFEGNSAAFLGGGAVRVSLPFAAIAPHCTHCSVRGDQEEALLPNVDCGFPMDQALCPQNPVDGATATPILSTFVASTQSNSLLIQNVTFRGNKADCPSCLGGALNVNNGKIRIDSSRFQYNQAGRVAGAIVAGGDASLTISSSTFVGDAALFDPTLSSRASGPVYLEGYLLVQPSATAVDGQPVTESFNAIQLEDVGNVTVAKLRVECPPGFKAEDRSLGVTLRSVAGWTNLMLGTSVNYRCAPCGPGYYALSGGGLTQTSDNILHSPIHCRECPFGGICTGKLGPSIVEAGFGFWGTIGRRESESGDSEWAFTQCPKNYCCSASAGCDDRSNSTQSCASGRNVSLPLCGGCNRGYSQDLRSARCVPDSECNAARWLIPIVLIAVLIWAAALLLRRPGQKGAGHDVDNGDGFRVLLFFYQNAPLVHIEGPQRNVVVLWVIGLLNLHVANTGETQSDAAHACIAPAVSSAGSLGIQLVAPSMVVVAMGLWLIVYRVLVILARGNGHLSRMMDKAPSPNIKLGLLRVALLFYTSVVKTTTTLLTCVQVGGLDSGRLRLFQAGEVECYTAWQGGLWALFFLLVVPFPAVLCLWLYRERRRADQDGADSETILYLTSKYSDSCWYWQIVILLRRLLFAMIFSFAAVAGPTAQALLFTLAAGAFVIHETAMRPYAIMTDRITSVTQLALLAILSLFSNWSANFTSLAATTPPVESSAWRTTIALETLQDIVFFLPLVAPLIFFAQRRAPAVVGFVKRVLNATRFKSKRTEREPDIELTGSEMLERTTSNAESDSETNAGAAVHQI